MGKGRKRCVPGCNSNYNNTDNYVSLFTFPKDATRKKQWVKSINRAYCIPSSTAVVCIKHFSSQFIIKKDRVVRDDGSELVVKRKILKLTNDAYPSIFLNQPSYLSHEPSTSRKSPSERITALKLRDEQKFAEWCMNHTVNSFEIFQETYAKKLGDGCLNIRTYNSVLCYRLDFNQNPSIDVSIKIYKNLTIEIFHDSVLLKTKCCKRSRNRRL
ncbi:hypothetical protein AVEN_254066-1 [Araneus ventricosus]|uniref:THAP-type domain-containing protein n=1 Tax=Araneus ventricosus TaxID=182803 RepID=A0A4Y2BXP4_ARAVE|nr:hypothetical protein AVEN_254066-1 [Araneus ventricosus]